MTQPFANKMMNKLFKKRISKKHKRQNNKTKQKPRNMIQHIQKITRINPKTYINSLIYHLIETTDYDLLQILLVIMNKNEENYKNNKNQSEIVIIKLKSNKPEERYIILIDFTIRSKTELEHIYTTSLNEAILQALNEKKKIYFF